MQLYFTTLTNNKRYVEYKAKIIKQGDRSSQSSGLGEWSTEHGDGAFPGWCDFFFVQGQDDKESKSQESAGQFQSQGAGRAELGKAREFEKLKTYRIQLLHPG